MLQADVGDDAQDGRDDVGRVEPAAQTRLDDSDVHRFGREKVESHRRRNFEKRRPMFREERMPPVQERLNLFPRDHPETISFHNLHPLAEIHQMRRGIEPDLQPAGRQSGRQHMRSRALAVGPGNMDAAELPVRMPKRFVKRRHRLNSRLISHLPDLLVRRELIEQPVYLFFVCFHSATILCAATDAID